jgi:hypothetical protein
MAPRSLVTQKYRRPPYVLNEFLEDFTPRDTAVLHKLLEVFISKCIVALYEFLEVPEHTWR